MKIRPVAILAALLIVAMTFGLISPTVSAETVPDASSAGEYAISCEIGKSFAYRYDGMFVDSATITSVSDVDTGNAMLSADGEFAIAAVEESRKGCMYAVEMSGVDVREAVGREVVQQSRPDENAELVKSTFYYMQQPDGTISDVYLSREMPTEIQFFQRGLVDALNVTMKSERGEYSVVESDASGTHKVHYIMKELGREGVSFIGSYTEADYLESPKLAKAAAQGINTSMTNTTTSTFNPLYGVIQSVTIDETFIITEPDSSSPPITDFLRHGTMQIQAAVTIDMTAVNVATNVRDLRAGLDSDEMVRLSLSAEISPDGDVDFDHSELIASLLTELEAEPSSPALLTELTRAIEEDSNGVAQLADYIKATAPTGDLAQTLTAALVTEGSEAAQALIVTAFLSGNTDEATVTDALITVSIVQTPSVDMLRAVNAIRLDANNGNYLNATLVMGALANKLIETEPALATRIADSLVSQMEAAPDIAEAEVLLNALGNAGVASTVDAIAPYLQHEDAITRMTAVQSLRKIESAETTRLLTQLLAVETNYTVQLAIAAVAETQGNEDLLNLIMMPPVIVDEEWEDTFGLDFASVDMAASALVEINPVIVDLQADVTADIFNNMFDVAQAQLLSEPDGATERRFLLNLELFGNVVYTSDDSFLCSHGSSGTFWDGTVNLPDVETTVFSIAGLIALDFDMESSIDYAFDYDWNLTWCGITEVTGHIEITPNAQFNIDGSATLTLLVVRGGIGARGILIAAEVPSRVDLSYDIVDGLEVCVDVDLDITLADAEIYGWAQGWALWWGWQPNPRPDWVLAEFDLSPDVIEIVEECWEGGLQILQCVPDVIWHDGTVIDAWYDGANCFVKGGYGSSLSPFTQNNAYYIAPTSGACPAGSTWDGVGCFVLDLHPFQMVWVDFGLLYVSPYMGSCPVGTSPNYGGWPSEIISCTVTYVGGSVTWYQIAGDLYFNASQSCSEGNLDGIGCWLGDAPTGKNPFYYSPTNAFYYVD